MTINECVQLYIKIQCFCRDQGDGKKENRKQVCLHEIFQQIKESNKTDSTEYLFKETRKITQNMCGAMKASGEVCTKDKETMERWRISLCKRFFGQ